IAESDLLTINYTSGTTARPKGVMITHRNAYMNSVGTLLHLRMDLGDRYLWTLPMFHANGWTYTWTVTAAGATHVCLPVMDPARVFELLRKEQITWLCAAPTVLIMLSNASGPTVARSPPVCTWSPRELLRPPKPSNASRTTSGGPSPTCTVSPKPPPSSPCASNAPSTRICPCVSGQYTRPGRVSNSSPPVSCV